MDAGIDQQFRAVEAKIETVAAEVRTVAARVSLVEALNTSLSERVSEDRIERKQFEAESRIDRQGLREEMWKVQEHLNKALYDANSLLKSQMLRWVGGMLLASVSAIFGLLRFIPHG